MIGRERSSRGSGVSRSGRRAVAHRDAWTGPARSRASRGAVAATSRRSRHGVRHTSASLVIQENADPSAKRDLERWLNRLVPEGDPFYEHDTEGPDDMPAHIKAALTATSLSIPIFKKRLALGTWQGIYLWEHRRRGSRREVIVHVV
jgi:secondary thiamine-phosphate synthase enzyme